MYDEVTYDWNRAYALSHVRDMIMDGTFSKMDSLLLPYRNYLLRVDPSCWLGFKAFLRHDASIGNPFIPNGTTLGELLKAPKKTAAYELSNACILRQELERRGLPVPPSPNAFTCLWKSKGALDFTLLAVVYKLCLQKILRAWQEANPGTNRTLQHAAEYMERWRGNK
jgi:hypothetical protein